MKNPYSSKQQKKAPPGLRDQLKKLGKQISEIKTNELEWHHGLFGLVVSILFIVFMTWLCWLISGGSMVQ